MSILPASSIGDEATGFYDYEIQNSMLFNGSGGLRFSSGEANTSYWTLSVWIKRHELGGNYATIMSATNYGSTYQTDVIGFGSANTMYSIRGSNANSFTGNTGTRVVRDITNWSHYCLRNSGGTVTRWLNGVQDSTYSVSGTFIGIGRSGNHDIGAYGGSSASYNNKFSLADFYFINDSSFGASDVYDWTQFAEFKNGVLVPKKNSLTAAQIGDGGIFLQFQQTGGSADSSGIGADTSGNDHHASVIGTVSDFCKARLDTPTNNFMTFNGLHQADTTSINNIISDGSLKAHCDSDDGIFTTIEIPTSGKWYVEVMLGHVSKPTGVYLMGNQHEHRDDWTHTSNYTSFFEGFSIQGSTNKVFEYGGSEIGSTHSNGTIYAFLIDVDNNTYDIYQNDTKILDAGSFDHPGFQEGVVLGVGNNSDSGTNNCNFYLNAGQDSSFGGEKTSGSSNESDAGGVGDFYYATKGGLALCAKNLPDTVVSPAKSDQASDFFKVLDYAGDGNNNRDVTGIGFKPDITWIKETNSTSHWAYVDSSRGYENFNSFSDNIADSTGVTNNNSTRTNDSFQVTNSGATNESGKNYISYHWKVNGGTEVTNNEGTVTSQVQANADLGISIIRYTGTGTDPSGGGVTLGHGLTKAPELVHHKNRVSTTAGNNYGTWWSKFHAGTNMSFSAFDSNNTGGWNGSPIDADVVTPPIANYGNVNGDTYFMYCWHSVEGFSKVGKYEGNGNTGDNQFVYTGFEPAFLIIKNIDSGHSWTLRDNLHGHYYSSDIGNPVNIGMRFKAEVNTGGTAFMIDLCSNGFKLRGADADVGATNTYIYLAMASDRNFKFGNAR